MELRLARVAHYSSEYHSDSGGERNDLFLSGQPAVLVSDHTADYHQYNIYVPASYHPCVCLSISLSFCLSMSVFFLSVSQEDFRNFDISLKAFSDLLLSSISLSSIAF